MLLLAKLLQLLFFYLKLIFGVLFCFFGGFLHNLVIVVSVVIQYLTIFLCHVNHCCSHMFLTAENCTQKDFFYTLSHIFYALSINANNFSFLHTFSAFNPLLQTFSVVDTLLQTYSVLNHTFLTFSKLLHKFFAYSILHTQKYLYVIQLLS